MYKLQSLKIKNIISFKDATFQFRNGKAIIIVGQNLDDQSQAGNGSGKSSLIESIALAFTGCSIRDVKVKELIFNGAESGEVELTLWNETVGQEFSIWRKLYTNSKSAEYKAWINNKEQSERYSDLNMFNSFVWETIGITKEDFFSFFLITKDNYKPFLTVGDKDKKEVINRFSGADKVDHAFPLIEEDSGRITQEVLEIEKELLKNQTKQELLAGQLMEEEERVSDETRNLIIESKTQDLNALYEDDHLHFLHIEDSKKEVKLRNFELLQYEATIGETLQPFRDHVELAELEVEAFEFSENFGDELVYLDESKRIKQQEINLSNQNLSNVKNQFIKEINECKETEQLLKNDLQEYKINLQEYEQFESDVNKKLQDAIECPACNHIFSFRDKEFNIQEAKESLPYIEEEIKRTKESIHVITKNINEDIPVVKQNINNKILQAQEGIKNDITGLNIELVELGSSELTLKRKYQEEQQNKQELLNNVTTRKRQLKNKEDEINHQKQQFQNKIKQAELTLKQKEHEQKAHIEEINQLQAAIQHLRKQELDKSNIEKLTNDIESLVIEEDKIKNRLETKRKELESVTSWELHFKNFKSHLANKSIKNIQDYTNLFLEGMGSNLAIAIDGYKTLSNKKLKEQITTSVLREGFDAGSYGKFSGGERGRIDICTIIAMQELILLNSGGKGVDLLIADEILDQVDTLGLESIINSLQALQKTIMIVSQNEINTLADYTLTVQKKNKVSSILN